MPRPIPLGTTGMPQRLGQPQGGVLGAVRPHVGAEHEHRAPGLAQQRGDLGEVVRVRFEPHRGPRAGGASVSARLNSSSIGTSRNTGPRCGIVATRNASATRSVTWAAERTVAACLVTGASSGGWSSSCSAPLPQRNAGARPPSTTTGAPLN